jgi:hypothetical protein
MLDILRLLIPYVGALLAVFGLILMLVYAPNDAKVVMATEYSSFVKVIAAAIGPTAVAVIGSFAATGRPVFNKEDHAAKVAYWTSKWAACIIFGIGGGLVTKWTGWDVAGYTAAGFGGVLGVQIVNVVFNRVLDKWVSPEKAG